MANFISGGGAPFGWSVSGPPPKVDVFSKPKAFSLREFPRYSSVDLLSRLTVPWTPRNQGRRATCSAFAVVAAEELARALEKGEEEILPLSEEFLYHQMRTNYPPKWNLEPEVQAYLKKSGATFLDQAAQVLEQEGICLRDALPYQNDVGLSASHIAQLSAAEETALQSKAAGRRVVYESNTWEGPNRPEFEDPWLRSHGGLTVSQTLFSMLEQNIPVAASFMMPLGSRRYGWESPMAKHCGQVRYKPVQTGGQIIAKDGHAVCLIGFIVRPDDPERGWFIFRNSRGTRFAHNPQRDCPSGPSYLSNPGYGTISTSVVDRYCWEYTHRKPPDLATQ